MLRNLKSLIWLVCSFVGAIAIRGGVQNLVASDSVAVQQTAEFGRYRQLSRQHANLGKTPDLDWKECGAKSGFNARQCNKTDGCAVQRLWLDTPRRVCRFTDEYKLRPKEVPRFFEVEIKRLLEKSKTFASNGCIFGGWLAKCYRRTQQILRLLRYVRQAVTVAKADPDHPSHGLASSKATHETLKVVMTNLGEGFRKNSWGKALGLEIRFDDAFVILKQHQQDLQRADELATAKNTSLTEVEKTAMQNTASVNAALAMAGTVINDEQRKELHKLVEAAESSVPMENEDKLDAALSDLTGELDSAMKSIDDADLDEINRQEGSEGIDEMVGHALLETVSRDHDVVTGTGPLKWLVQNALGWFIYRFAWLVLFVGASVVGIITGPARVLLFPLLWVGCVLSKFLVWVFRDFAYNLLWEGETEKVLRRYVKIGKCAPWMWNFIGFETNSTNIAQTIAGASAGGGVGAGVTAAAAGASAGIALGAVVGGVVGTAVGQGVLINAARFASTSTGIYHLWKDAKDLCSSVTCPLNSQCHAGTCRCNRGTTPLDDMSGCGLIQTINGCVCRKMWNEELLGGLWSADHYGCAPPSAMSGGRSYCQVDMDQSDQKTCKPKPGAKGLVQALNKFVDQGSISNEYDKCTPVSFEAEVPSMGPLSSKAEVSKSEGGQ